jgi:hypothetical protein
VVIPSRSQSTTVHYPRTSLVESTTKAVIAKPSPEPFKPPTTPPIIVPPSEPLLPSTLTQAESPSLSSDY